MFYKLVNRKPKPTDAMGFEKMENRIVAQTQKEKVLVSTVFLGLDHSFGGGDPLFFETLVFGGPMNGEMERYCTWDQAEAGHKEMCGRVFNEKK